MRVTDVSFNHAVGTKTKQLQCGVRELRRAGSQVGMLDVYHIRLLLAVRVDWVGKSSDRLANCSRHHLLVSENVALCPKKSVARGSIVSED